MKRALVISSLVASSSVGANNSAFCLRRLGIETVVLPTVLLGRHPGWGPPGGSETPIEILSDIWNGIKAQNIKFDIVLTGYIGNQDNAALAVDIIRSVKNQNPKVLIIVDPVMGDNDKLYVPVDVARAIETQLIPLADIITPNIWEFSHLMKADFRDLTEIRAALLDYGGCALITSVRHQDQIGALSYHPEGLTYFGHEIFESVPHGGGDAVAGTLAAHLLADDNEEIAAQKAVSSIFGIIKMAVKTKQKELPLIQHQDMLLDAPQLTKKSVQ